MTQQRTQTISPEHVSQFIAAQDRFRAALRKPAPTRRFAQRAPGDTRDTLNILKEFGPFTVSDLAAVANLSWSMAKRVIAGLHKDQRIEVWADGLRYVVATAPEPTPCRALLAPADITRLNVWRFIVTSSMTTRAAFLDLHEKVIAVPALEPCSF